MIKLKILYFSKIIQPYYQKKHEKNKKLVDGEKCKLNGCEKDKNEINFTYVPGNKSASEITWRYVISLQSFFKSNNIKYIFFEGDINKDGFLDKTCKIAELVDFDYFYEEPFLGSAGNRVTECNHPDAEVQTEWAEKLYNFINTEFILI